MPAWARNGVILFLVIIFLGNGTSCNFVYWQVIFASYVQERGNSCNLFLLTANFCLLCSGKGLFLYVYWQVIFASYIQERVNSCNLYLRNGWSCSGRRCRRRRASWASWRTTPVRVPPPLLSRCTGAELWRTDTDSWQIYPATASRALLGEF